MLWLYWKSLLANLATPSKLHHLLRLLHQFLDFLYSSRTFPILVQVAFEYQVFMVPCTRYALARGRGPGEERLIADRRSCRDKIQSCHKSKSRQKDDDFHVGFPISNWKVIFIHLCTLTNFTTVFPFPRTDHISDKYVFNLFSMMSQRKSLNFQGFFLQVSQSRITST